MTIWIGINGFGRMGRLGLRVGWDKPELKFAHINEIATDAKGSAHLLRFDTVHGTWNHDCTCNDDSILVDCLPID